MLHIERKRLKEIDDAEARGESLWTDRFDMPVRVKIHRALTDASGEADAWIAARARNYLLDELGQYNLGEPYALPEIDFFEYLRGCSDEMMPSVIEALVKALNDAASPDEWSLGVSPEEFTEAVSRILNRHRIAYSLLEGEMVAMGSQALHAGVVEPVLRLLAGTRDLVAVETAYQEALREVTKGTPDDAITDAARALEEMLRACGCKGNTIGELANSARKTDLLAPHDTSLAAGLQTIVDWVSADRSQKGDVHRTWNPMKEDAWLTIYVVGALIVRLAATSKR